MKIVIELTDAVLMRAVEEQVGKAVAAYTDDAINRQVSVIVAKKLERYGATEQTTALERAASGLLTDTLSTNIHARQTQLRNLLSDAAVKIIKEAR